MRPSRRRLTEQGADLAARNERLIVERDAALEEARAAKHAAKTAACLFKEADEKYVDTCIVNERLTSDLTAARERLAEFAGRRTVAEVLEEHDVHRKALADALGDQKRHLNWEQLIGEAGRLAEAALDQMAGHVKEKARADHLQKELDNALGLPPGGPLSSALWQPGYQAPAPDKAVSP